MKPILALDTSAAHCAAALLLGDRVAADISEPMAKGQAERLLPLAEEVLRDSGLEWRDLGLLVSGIGPGNFTGIRITVAAVRGLALGLGIPATGVSSFEAHAHGRQAPVRIALDARRARVFVQGFGTEPAEPCQIEDTEMAGLGRNVPWLSDVPDRVEAMTGSPATAIGLPSAAAMARVAAARPECTAFLPAPLYLRPADAAPPAEALPRILDDA